ncbi:hypothetical protein Xen7305DRAFT_00015780 [Xenococcus sp. PCC 7305]|uniref:hypothetical protein n=1 Tax=Xenococcus sp. PCC 7305 TaxID=102125 RepID=UPI0002ACED45|nr:hypothetical protein [Xenococcus sp. PCC 7305]ELS01871.1 hypothetical protein Xen7305DRAFT_00015780 [Xenococcus sp. PCC 7305]
MNLLNEITANLQEWNYQVLDDGTTMHSRRFSGKMHHKLRNTFNSAYNSFNEYDKTIIVSCFDSYTNITIFEE